MYKCLKIPQDKLAHCRHIHRVQMAVCARAPTRWVLLTSSGRLVFKGIKISWLSLQILEAEYLPEQYFCMFCCDTITEGKQQMLEAKQLVTHGWHLIIQKCTSAHHSFSKIWLVSSEKNSLIPWHLVLVVRDAATRVLAPSAFGSVTGCLQWAIQPFSTWDKRTATSGTHHQCQELGKAGGAQVYNKLC